MIGFAVSLAGHLDQAGEAYDLSLAQREDCENDAPKGVYPLFVPADIGKNNRL